MGPDSLKSGFYYTPKCDYVAALVSVDCWKWLNESICFRTDHYSDNNALKVGPLELLKWQDN